MLIAVPLISFQLARLIALSIILMLISTNFYGQSTSSTHASAEIMAPVGTTRLELFDFANFEVGSKAGSIDVNSKVSGGVRLGKTNKDSKVFSFNIIDNSYDFDITLPSSDIILTRNGGVETMTVGSFSITSPSRNALDTNTQVLAIGGGKVKVPASQAAGHYDSATPIAVTVNYN